MFAPEILHITLTLFLSYLVSFLWKCFVERRLDNGRDQASLESVRIRASHYYSSFKRVCVERRGDLFATLLSMFRHDENESRANFCLQLYKNIEQRIIDTVSNKGRRIFLVIISCYMASLKEVVVSRCIYKKDNVCVR